MKPKHQLLLLLLLVFVTRMPFIFDGYGVEEDSWGLVVNAYEMKTTGHYVASRVPGHPLQEYVYRAIYDAPAWAYNLPSVLTSMMAVAFFFLALRKMQLRAAFPAALAFSFVPVFYIAGTYTIDFAWTMAFVMGSFYFLLDRKFILSGIFLGLATGCRITAEVFLLPWALILFSRLNFKNWIREMLLVGIPAVVIGAMWFIPAYLNYGKGFFDYSDQFPYPPMAKVIYKATIGVFGLIGIVAMLVYLFPALRNWKKESTQPVTLFSTDRLLLVCLLILLLHIVAYLRLPQKSGYMAPAIPFVILFFATSLSTKQFRWFTIATVFSPLLFSINLTDPLRGSESSSLSVKFHAAGQEIFIDPFSGPVFSERSKRLNKMAYCEKVIREAQHNDIRQLIISGWWYNEIQVHYLHKDNRLENDFCFYADCHTLDSAQAAGAKIFYLPEQNLYNDQMFGQQCTDHYAQPFQQP